MNDATTAPGIDRAIKRVALQPKRDTLSRCGKAHAPLPLLWSVALQAVESARVLAKDLLARDFGLVGLEGLR